MSTQEQRERFEAWAGNPPVEFEDKHKDLDSFWCWQAWQAAEAAAIERCAKTARGYSLQAEACIRALLPKEES